MRNLFIISIFCASAAVAGNFTRNVDPMIGTADHGHTFPGAVVPHGFVQLSPDTRLVTWDACSGYHYSDSTILGFSHTHLTGTGGGDMGDILLMPVVGEKPLGYEGGYFHGPDYRSSFSHANETARPGYYSVRLDNDDIFVELTATPRCGMHRYTYPKGSDAHVILDLEPSIYEQKHPRTVINVIDDRTICGLKYTTAWAPEHYVYYWAEFSQPFEYQLYSDAQTAVDGNAVEAENSKVVLKFVNLDEPLLVKVGISNVDEQGAHKNLVAEIDGWDFNAVADAADRSWDDALGRIEVCSGDDNTKKIFYTALYHTLIQPCVASDVDGRYRSMTGEIVCDPAYEDHTIFSLWDTFRGLHPLYTIIEPSYNQALIRTMLRKYDEMGILPKWELASNETGGMIGYHAVSVIADAWAKGQTDFDLEKALEAAVRSSSHDTEGIALDPEFIERELKIAAIRAKNELGYVPDNINESVSQGLEFALCDWLVARMAEHLGKDDIRELYDARALNYKHYFDPETRLMRPLMADGSFKPDFDPQLVTRPDSYVEGNSWQWTWSVQHDVPGLIELMGGRDEFKAQLDRLFVVEGFNGPDYFHWDLTGVIGQFAHGNEASQHIPYLYNIIGCSHDTQRLCDRIMKEFYSSAPDGICGNDDVGQISAWYVLNAMGFYPLCPGVPEYQLGRPMFDHVVIHLENGNDFHLFAHNNSADNMYTDAVLLNGRPVDGTVISHADIEAGGTLSFIQSSRQH